MSELPVPNSRMNGGLSRLTLPMDGMIERRLLISYRVDPVIARDLLPTGLRPQLVDGSAVAGICMIRLGRLRPAWMPSRIGWRFENAAHRIAVEWDGPDGPRTGVYIPERHSASRIPVAVGGRLFPGVHRHARFDTYETADRISVRLTAPRTTVAADVQISDDWSSALFPTLEDASDFFRHGSAGWSPARSGKGLEGLQLHTEGWQVASAEPQHIESSYFDALPHGSATFDSVLVMRDIPVRWTAPQTHADARQERQVSLH